MLLFKACAHLQAFLVISSFKYSYVSNNRVKLIIVLKGNLQLTSMSVIANNRVIANICLKNLAPRRFAPRPPVCVRVVSNKSVLSGIFPKIHVRVLHDY